jgi:hypothetical protein
LGLPIIGPEPDGSAASPVAGLSGLATSPAPTAAGSSAETTSPGATSPGSESSVSASGTAPIPPALLVTLETGLVGLPVPGLEEGQVIGPFASLADIAPGGGRGLPQGIVSRTWSSTDTRVGEDDQEDGQEVVTQATPEQVGWVQTAIAVVPGDASTRADALAVARADRLVRLAGWFADGAAPTPSEAPQTERSASLSATNLIAMAATADGGVMWLDGAPAGPWPDGRPHASSQADLGAPLMLLVGTALSYRLSRPIRKWWRVHHTAHDVLPRPVIIRRGGTPGTGRRLAAGS